VNDQPRHVDEKDHSIQYVFKLEVLHDSLIASGIHSHIKLLKDKHPLKVEYDDEDVCTTIERLNV
jgi:hypothetical protein